MVKVAHRTNPPSDLQVAIGRSLLASSPPDEDSSVYQHPVDTSSPHGTAQETKHLKGNNGDIIQWYASWSSLIAVV